MAEILPSGTPFYLLAIVSLLVLIFRNVISANLKPYIDKYGILEKYIDKVSTKKNYFKNLYAELSKMPFVLHDFELDIEGNYVEVLDNKIDIESLKVEERRIVYQEYEIKPFVLILGNAGIGKTTFTRNIILKIINKKYKILNYEAKELKKVIPIYVPLKIIDNSTRNPVLKYILNNNSYYKNNEEKLERDLRNRNVFLFLDGYDEVSTVANRNYLREELILIFGSGTNTLNFRYDDKYASIYNAMYLSKVWLTSRKEFYKSNLPIPTQHMVKYKENIAGVALEGVDDERLKLVNILFSKYFNNNNELKALLDGEFFIYEIDNSRDKELISLSKVPLFLTVMCYIYINDVKNTKDTKIKFLSDYYSLINKFIELLLIELDEEKVKNHTIGKKNAYLRRRNNYTEKKLAFIKYFAFKNFDADLNTFTIDQLKQAAINYFFDDNEVLENLRDGKKNNIVDEIINNGIFSYIGIVDDIDQYDFPHRKFKEILGVQFIIDQQDTNYITKELIKGESFELGYEYFKKIDNKTDFISLLVQKLYSLEQSKHICTFLYEYCLEEQHFANLIVIEIQKEIQKLSPQSNHFYISQKLYESLNFTEAYYNFLLEKIISSNYNRSTFISLLFYSKGSVRYDDVLRDNDYIYHYLTYVKSREINPAIVELEEKELKQFILSIVTNNKKSIDENIFTNCFAQISKEYLLPLLNSTKILDNQFRIFEKYKYEQTPSRSDLIFDIELIMKMKKLKDYFKYLCDLYHITDSIIIKNLEKDLHQLTEYNSTTIQSILDKHHINNFSQCVITGKSYQDTKIITSNIDIYK
ncbi:hypothetical protein EIZ47_10140 [Chryseobacterium lacus]|uniref:NACHT domain-containing protein n=1 Tax=Chryseobacterium lacus TaxID=2058346 RepID=A0A368MWA1_9FLAO|nr:hypothetical protein [Chryseobacterium lacus]RCU42296.1 hypothetical protein DQ356_10235 [Chryseobacterium lacus]RST26594.1 hypothetical protein EIZ47_10140 [Chryseobacterium lacus]